MEIKNRLHNLIVKLFKIYAAKFFHKFHVSLHHRVKSLFSESPRHFLKNGHFKNVQKKKLTQLYFIKIFWLLGVKLFNLKKNVSEIIKRNDQHINSKHI